MTDNRGYREDLRGHWFGHGSSNFFYVYKEDNITTWYLINEQENYLIKIDNPEISNILNYTYYAPAVSKDSLEWLKDEKLSKIKYFDSFDEYKEWYDKTMQELESDSKDDRDER